MPRNQNTDHTRPTVAKTLCRCCSAGCGLSVTIKDGIVADIRGDRSHTLSKGYICPKAYGLPQHHYHPDRLNQAILRGTPVSWDTCTENLANSISDIVTRHGPDAFGAYSGSHSGLDFLSGWVLNMLLTRIGTSQKYSPTTIDMAPAYRAGEMVAGSAAELVPR